MLRISSKLPFPLLKRVKQANSFYCGPAVIQMLLSFHDFKISQKRVVIAAAVKRKIKNHGMTLFDLTKATHKLAPQFQFWHKKNATIKNLSLLVNKYKYPVGVEWQGLFDYKSIKEENKKSLEEMDTEIRIFQNALDFNDLLLVMTELLKSHPDVLESLQNRFHYF